MLSVLIYLKVKTEFAVNTNAYFWGFLKAELVKEAFAALRQLLCTAESSAKPSDVRL